MSPLNRPPKHPVTTRSGHKTRRLMWRYRCAYACLQIMHVTGASHGHRGPEGQRPFSRVSHQKVEPAAKISPQKNSASPLCRRPDSAVRAPAPQTSCVPFALCTEVQDKTSGLCLTTVSSFLVRRCFSSLQCIFASCIFFFLFLSLCCAQP